MTLPRIELVPRRQEDLQQGRRDYLIYARERQVGRIYETHYHTKEWFWGVQGVFPMPAGPEQWNVAADFDHAKAKLRVAFDLWLEWALSVPTSHLLYGWIQQDLRDVGALAN